MPQLALQPLANLKTTAKQKAPEWFNATQNFRDATVKALETQIKQVAVIARCQFEATCEFIASKFDPIASAYHELICSGADDAMTLLRLQVRGWAACPGVLPRAGGRAVPTCSLPLQLHLPRG